MDLVTLFLGLIAVIEGFVGVLQLVQMVGSRVLLGRINAIFQSFSTDPEARKGLFAEIAHGVMKALSERQGALKGAASRQMEAGLNSDVSGLAISGLASFLPKKYQAFAPLIAPYVQQFHEKSPLGQQGGSGQSPGQGQGQPV